MSSDRSFVNVLPFIIIVILFKCSTTEKSEGALSEQEMNDLVMEHFNRVKQFNNRKEPQLRTVDMTELVDKKLSETIIPPLGLTVLRRCSKDGGYCKAGKYTNVTTEPVTLQYLLVNGVNRTSNDTPRVVEITAYDHAECACVEP